MKIRDLFKFKPLNLWADVIEAEKVKVPLPLSWPILDKKCLVGIEVEVENLETYPTYNKLWSVIEDGSLRNNGREFISAPIQGETIEYAVRRLFLDLEKHKPIFSKRCSVHVHMNARTMTCEQVYAMMLTYLVLEKTLFKWIGEDRAKNIHCVPLRECKLTSIFPHILSGTTMASMWMKYTAVNLVPLEGKGTIEFRHMHGTGDADRILTWISLLLKIKLYCYKRTLQSVKDELFALNTNSEYIGFVHKVFEEYTKVLDISAKDLEEGVSLIKLYTESDAYMRSLVAPSLKGKAATVISYDLETFLAPMGIQTNVLTTT